MKVEAGYWDYDILLELYILKNDKINVNDILSEDIRWIENIINYLRKTIQQ